MRKEKKVFTKGFLFHSRYWVRKNMEMKGYSYDEYTIVEVKSGMYTAALNGFIPDKSFIDKMGGFIEPEKKGVINVGTTEDRLAGALLRHQRATGVSE